MLKNLSKSKSKTPNKNKKMRPDFAEQNKKFLADSEVESLRLTAEALDKIIESVNSRWGRENVNMLGHKIYLIEGKWGKNAKDPSGQNIFEEHIPVTLTLTYSIMEVANTYDRHKYFEIKDEIIERLLEITGDRNTYDLNQRVANKEEIIGYLNKIKENILVPRKKVKKDHSKGYKEG